MKDRILNIVKGLIVAIIVCFGSNLKAQNNLNVAYYDVGSTTGGTGGSIGLDVTTLDSVFGTVTVNGAVLTADIFNSNQSISQLPTTVSAYSGIQLLYIKGLNATAVVPAISKAQADALIDYVKGGGILVANMEGINVQTVNQDFNKYVGQALLLQAGVNISANAAATAIASTAVAYHNNGGVLNLNNGATSVETTTSASTFLGIPYESVVFSVTKPTTSAQCSTIRVLDFIAPSYPGDNVALSNGILGFAYLSGEVQGPLNARVTPSTGMRNDGQANLNLANMIYDYLYNRSNMITRRAWSKTASNVNSFCPVTSTAAECAAFITAPSLSGTTLSNTCPASTVNLNGLHNGTTPSGASLVWFTNNAHTGTAYATPTTAAAGTYYAFYYDSVNNCYSPASSAVTVNITNCCDAGTTAPTVGSFVN